MVCQLDLGYLIRLQRVHGISPGAGEELPPFLEAPAPKH